MDKLDPNWLAIELAAIDEDVAHWSDGLKQSFNSHFPNDPSKHIPLGRPRITKRAEGGKP